MSCCSEDGVLDDPLQVAVDASVDARGVGLSAADAPGHDTNCGPSTALKLQHQRPSRVALTTKELTVLRWSRNSPPLWNHVQKSPALTLSWATLMIEAVSSSWTSVNICRTTRPSISEDSYLHEDKSVYKSQQTRISTTGWNSSYEAKGNAVVSIVFGLIRHIKYFCPFTYPLSCC